MIMFVTGGVRSGKSAYAEKRAIGIHQHRKGQLSYIATSQVYDQEMERRVKLHQKQRQQGGVNWNVIEQEKNIETLFSTCKEDDVVLLDCMTTLLSNELFAGWEDQSQRWEDTSYQVELFEKLTNMFVALSKSPWPTIIVSNELAFDFLHHTQGTISYMNLLGKLHQQLVRLAEEVVLVEYGLPQFMKGGEVK